MVDDLPHSLVCAELQSTVVTLRPAHIHKFHNLLRQISMAPAYTGKSFSCDGMQVLNGNHLSHQLYFPAIPSSQHAPYQWHEK